MKGYAAHHIKISLDKDNKLTAIFIVMCVLDNTY